MICFFNFQKQIVNKIEENVAEKQGTFLSSFATIQIFIGDPKIIKYPILNLFW